MRKKEQVASQMVILVDENDKFLGKYALRHEAHTGDGIHHRAFVCFLINNTGEVLLQKRKHWMWDGLWDLTAISHVLHVNGRDETYEEATTRALKKEMGITGVKTKELGGFNYFAKHEKDGGCENEYCAIMFGRYTGSVAPNPEDVYEYKWMDFEEFTRDIKVNSRFYAPWAVLTVETLSKTGQLDKFTVDILGLLKKYQAQVDKSLEKVLPRRATSQSLRALIGPTRFKLHEEALNKAINEPVWDFLDRGGKRWRPTLFLMIVDLLGKNPNEFVVFSTIFELIHNGTLMVDDVEDSSSLRRGKPALHLVYGVDIAINTGNMLYYLPLKVLDKYTKRLSKDVLLAVYKTYRDEMINLGIGQATDIVWHRGLVDDLKISPAQYFQMCAFKTGCLARMASKMAAIVGRASPKLIDAFGRLGESLGVVFQIQDDILNITENELSAKKGLGEDITEGKRSLPVIYAFSSLPRPKAAWLRKILLMHTREKKLIKEATGLIMEAKAVEKAQKTMQKLFTDAWSELDLLLPESPKKDRLYNLAYFLINRQV